MSAAHTPGPWKLDPSCKDGARPTRSVRVKHFGKIELLTTVHFPDTYMGSNGAATREANARLIAAAPDLLAALIALDDYVCNNLASDYPTGIDVDDSAFKTARAAIAKATGAAP